MDCPEVDEIEAAFPGKLDEIATEICEMMWDDECSSQLEEGDDGYIWMSDKQAMDACNHVITGVFWLGGKEYSFEAESGNWNGWVWRSIGADTPVPDIEIHHTKWALQPKYDLVGKALSSGSGKFLLAKWDHFLSRKEVSSIPGNYSYDRHFQPGSQVEKYWNEKASKYGFELVDQETSDATRKQLSEAVN